MEDLRLIRPTPELKDEYLELVGELKTEGEGFPSGPLSRTAEKFFAAGENYELFCRQLIDQERHEGLPPGIVPQTTYWLVRDGKEIIGESRLRHWLNDFLEQEGGNIGYAIRATERGKGYGTIILALTLEKARALGIKKVLVTCDKTNTASARVIEKNGEVLAGEGISSISKSAVLRYWIETA